jgi:hypothetical protein
MQALQMYLRLWPIRFRPGTDIRIGTALFQRAKQKPGWKIGTGSFITQAPGLRVLNLQHRLAS